MSKMSPTLLLPRVRIWIWGEIRTATPGGAAVLLSIF